MRLCIQRQGRVGQSMLGLIFIQAGSGANFEALSLERNWDDNRAGKSCVPAGFYYLEPHNGTKYQNTYALIGQHVSHAKEPDVPRYACVCHWARTGGDLQGCFSVGDVFSLTHGPTFAELHDPRVDELLEILRASQETHYMTILDPPRMATALHVED